MSTRVLKRIAVLVPSGATSNWRKLEGIMGFARTCPDWEIRVVTSERLAEIKRSIRSFDPDGLICALMDEPAKRYVASLSLPTVVAFHAEGSTFPGEENFRYVTSDSEKIGRRIARHVYAKGYRTFLCVGKRGSRWEHERFDAFERELAKFHCRVSRMPAASPSADLLKALGNLPPRSAVFAADDNVAIDVLDLSRKNGMPVPHRFGVIGVSNLTIQCENSHPALTSLDQNFEYGGYLSARRMKALLMDGIVPKISFYAPGEICERNSLPALHARLSLPVDIAMAFIEHNVRNPIEVPDVVAAADVSRRTLENLFRTELSTSIAAVIRNKRLDHLAGRITTSDAALSGICLDCGWPHAEHAMRLFKTRFGMTMQTYRSRHRTVTA